MPADTPDQQITLPVGADLADVVAAMANAIADIQTRLNLRYVDTADRTLRHAVGIEGERSDLATEGWGDAFDGTNWISATARGYRAMKVRTSNAAAINSGTTGTTLVNDTTLVAPVEANGDFIFGGELFYDSPTAADMKMAFTWPGAPASVRWGAIGRNITTTSSLEMPVNTVSGTASPFAGMGVGTPTWVKFAGYLRNVAGTAGNLQLQYAQNTADVGNFTVYAGSKLWVLRTS